MRPTLSEPRYEVADERFRRLVIPNTQMEQLYDNCRWAEGPVWFNDGGYLVWSDIPNDRMLRWLPNGDVSVFRAAADYSNGNTRDRQGRLVSCQHGGRCVTRTEPDGRITVLAERFAGKRLNSPNDVVVHADGSIWFTDPTYGILSDYEGYRAEPEQKGSHLYRIDPHSGEVTCMADDFQQPNGLAFSADFSRLYVADSARTHDPQGAHHIRVFPVDAGGGLGESKVFAEIEPGIPDGLRVDVEGNVWTSAGDGIQCFAEDGRLLGKILLPEPVANLTFGGARGNRLFITANTSLYSIFVGVRGAQTP